MKNLTFASLRGTKTAIKCMTQSEAEQVEQICGFKPLSKRWSFYKECFCIALFKDSIKNNGFYANIYLYANQGYTIIPAADFIAANSGKIDVTGTNVGDMAKKPDSIICCPFCGNKPFEGHTKQGQHTIKCYDCAVEMTHDRQDKVRGHWNQRLQMTNPELPTDYIPLFNHLANEHDLTLIDSELREIALKVPIPENSLLEKIENLKKLIRIGVIVTKPKDRHDDLLTAIGQIEAEAKKVFER